VRVRHLDGLGLGLGRNRGGDPHAGEDALTLRTSHGSRGRWTSRLFR
jgi:hypothetical protein